MQLNLLHEFHICFNVDFFYWRKKSKWNQGLDSSFLCLDTKKVAKKNQGWRFFWEMAPSVLHVALQLPRHVIRFNRYLCFRMCRAQTVTLILFFSQSSQEPSLIPKKSKADPWGWQIQRIYALKMNRKLWKFFWEFYL